VHVLFHFLGALMLSRIGYVSNIGHVAKYQALNDDGAEVHADNQWLFMSNVLAEIMWQATSRMPGYQSWELSHTTVRAWIFMLVRII
jgi:hypothetical protein